MAKRNDLLPMAAIRGEGAMIAFDLVKSRGTHDPDAAAAKRVTVRALENGLVLLSCGIYGETIRILVSAYRGARHRRGEGLSRSKLRFTPSRALRGGFAIGYRIWTKFHHGRA